MGMITLKRLKDYKQCDEDGVMCTISRQAVDEAAQYIEELEYNLKMCRGNVDDLRKVRDGLEERLYNQAKTIHDLIKDNEGLRKSLAEAYGMMLEDIVDFAEQDLAYLGALRPSILELDEAIKRMK